MVESVGFDNEYEDRVDDVEDDANTKGDDYIDWLIDIDEDDMKESDECERR